MLLHNKLDFGQTFNNSKIFVVTKCLINFFFKLLFWCYIRFNNQMGTFHLNFGIYFNFGKGISNERIKQNFIDINISVVFQFFL
jgi:hypothetical protein